MKTGLKPLLWSGAAFLLLVLLAVPLLNLAALLFMMVPYVVLYTTLSRGSFLLHLLPVWLLAGLIAGPAVLIIGLFFLVPAVVIGHLYKSGAPAGKVIRMGTIVILALLMLELMLFQMVFDISLLNEMSHTIRSTFDSMQEQNLMAPGWDSEFIDMLIQRVIHMIPLTFIVLAFVYTVFSHYVSRRAVIRGGLDVPPFPKAKDWRLPRVLVIYYLIAYVIDLFIKPGDDSFLAVALMNLVPLLGYVFAIQAIGFFFFIAHEKKWSKAVPILIAIPVLLLPPLSLIGVLDTAFPIRKSFTKQQ